MGPPHHVPTFQILPLTVECSGYFVITIFLKKSMHKSIKSTTELANRWHCRQQTWWESQSCKTCRPFRNDRCGPFWAMRSPGWTLLCRRRRKGCRRPSRRRAAWCKRPLARADGRRRTWRSAWASSSCSCQPDLWWKQEWLWWHTCWTCPLTWKSVQTIWTKDYRVLNTLTLSWSEDLNVYSNSKQSTNIFNWLRSFQK